MSATEVEAAALRVPGVVAAAVLPPTAQRPEPVLFAVTDLDRTTFHDRLREQLHVQLPDDEAVALAMHLVNAGFASGNLASTYRMTEVLRQVFDIVEQSLGASFDRQGVNAARFVTHLRYFFVRLHSAQQFDEGRVSFAKAIRESYREAYTCAVKVQAVLQMRLGQ